jgi:hypothetical protein
MSFFKVSSTAKATRNHTVNSPFPAQTKPRQQSDPFFGMQFRLTLLFLRGKRLHCFCFAQSSKVRDLFTRELVIMLIELEFLGKLTPLRKRLGLTTGAVCLNGPPLESRNSANSSSNTA